MPDRLDLSGGPTVRAFIAVNLDQGLKDALVKVQERLKATHADVGWVRPESLHLTLKFLGQVEESRLGAVAEAIAAAAADYGSFRLVLGGLGAFPQPRAARVVWIAIQQGAEALATLHARVEAGLESLGFVREERPFAAHLTLGRVRGPARREQLAVALTSIPAGRLGEMMLHRIELMKSELGPGGARYTVLQTFPLA